MQSRFSLSTILIIAVTIALVVSPVLVPREISRWYLAAAANAYRLEDDTLAEHYLSRAKEWDPEIENDSDYYMAQLSRKRWQSDDEQLDILEKAISIDPRWAGGAERMAQLFVEEFDFERALRAIKLAYKDGGPQTPEQLNQLAYFRALAGVELTDALKDIRKAILINGRDPMLLDTEAWVLHSAGLSGEALPLIDEAVRKLEAQMGSEAQALPSPATIQEEPFDKMTGKLTWLDIVRAQSRIREAQQRLGRARWTLGVLRFHRLRILEALKKEEAAAADRTWLEARDFPITDLVT